MKVLIISLVVLAVLGGLAWKSSRFGYESASYQVIEKKGPFEIRQYDELVVASTQMDNSADPNSGGTFMRLFRYISKDNDSEQKIAMTTPVFMSQGDDAEMSFVVPQSVADGGAPVPKSEKVEVKSWNPGRVAVYRYSGSWENSDKQKARKKLEQWIADQKLEQAGEAFSAGYDPPFTPKFLRRNEVLIPIQ